MRGRSPEFDSTILYVKYIVYQKKKDPKWQYGLVFCLKLWNGRYVLGGLTITLKVCSLGLTKKGESGLSHNKSFSTIW